MARIVFLAAALALCVQARKKASPEVEALQELDMDKSGRVEQNELETFARAKGMTPEQIQEEFRTLDLNGDGVLEVEELRRTLQSSSGAGAPAAAAPEMAPAALSQAAPPAESSLELLKVANAVDLPQAPELPEAAKEPEIAQATFATPEPKEALDLRAQRGAERAVAELFEKRAASALAAMRQDTENAEKLEASARALRGQAKQLQAQVTAQVADAARTTADAIVQKVLRQVRLMSQEVASAEDAAQRHQQLADQAMEQAMSAQSKISAEVQRIKDQNVLQTA